jgi:hypothetical protein
MEGGNEVVAIPSHLVAGCIVFLPPDETRFIMWLKRVEPIIWM